MQVNIVLKVLLKIQFHTASTKAQVKRSLFQTSKQKTKNLYVSSLVAQSCPTLRIHNSL